MLGEYKKDPPPGWKESKDPKGYLKDLHGEDKGYITLMKIPKDKGIYHYHFTIDKLLEQPLEEQKDTYISMNTFFKPERRLENIQELRCLFVDIDCYNTAYAKFQIPGAIMEIYVKDYAIPTPTRIIDSGRGYYLIWDLKAVPYMVLPLWQALQDVFCNTLKVLGADPKCRDATRVLRVVGSINSKNNEQVKVIYDSGIEYDIHELKGEFLKPLEPRKGKKGRPKKFVAIYKERILYHARILDLIKLCELRNYEMTGYREVTLFLYRYWLCCFKDDPEEALKDTLDLNSEFATPLSEREATRATKSAETAYSSDDKQYKYKNETLVDLLAISDVEQQQLSTIFCQSEFKRRKSVRNRKGYKKNKKNIKRKYQENKDIVRQKYQENKDIVKRKYQKNKNAVKRKYQENKDAIKQKAKQKYYKNLQSQNKKTRNKEVETMQKKVLTLIAKGLKQEDICSILNISEKTYKRYKKRLKS